MEGPFERLPIVMAGLTGYKVTEEQLDEYTQEFNIKLAVQ